MTPSRWQVRRRRSPERRGSGPPRAPPNGVVLLLVLWTLMLLAYAAAQVVTTGRGELAVARNLVAGARAEAVADAAVAQAMLRVLATDPRERWEADGVRRSLTLDDGVAEVTIDDETARIDVNKASPTLLGAFFEALGAERADADRLAASVADYVDADNERRPLGAELGEYVDAGLAYGPANAPLGTVEELAAVLGMMPDLYRRAAP